MKKRWPNFKQHRSKTKCDAARWCPAPPATARTHTRGHRSVSKDGPVWKAGGDRAGPLWQRCEGNRSKEGNVTTAGRHGPRNGRPPTLSPPHLCCSLPWDSVPSGGSSALPPPCQEPAGGVPSPLTPRITFLPARQASVQGPAVTSHPPLRGLLCGAAVGDGAESGGCHHAQPSKRRL